MVSEIGRSATPILMPLYADEEITVAETDGLGTIANAQNVFTGYLDPDFKNWGTDVPSDPTEEQEVKVYEMCEDATFAETFGSLGELGKLVLTQGQIICFCIDHRDKLRTNCHSTFFLFKVGEEYLVVVVSVRRHKLEVNVHRFGDSYVWSADCRYRVVAPQL
ncbi:MAG: hypothetical protein CEN90_267 [Parcubacteria group bacterium Licking1014_17]|nr:MAG: hypothetical protein CEN90_267 [Parcubacteria group bacterium Licking1014_17]